MPCLFRCPARAPPAIPLLPVFVASLRAAPAFFGLVEGLADATSSLLKLASGYFADRSRAKKPLVLFGYGMAAIVRPLVALATAPWHVLAVRVTDRVGKGIRSAPRDVLIANSVSKEESGRAFVVSGWIVYAVTYLAFGVASQSRLLQLHHRRERCAGGPAHRLALADVEPASRTHSGGEHCRGIVGGVGRVGLHAERRETRERIAAIREKCRDDFLSPQD